MIDVLRRHKTTAKPPATESGDGIVHVTLPSLLNLYRGAASLQLQPQRIRAQSSGGYLSPFKGRGMEFDEVRPYAQGDDVRTIDWRVTARTGRPHTKLFREERERPVLLWIDLRTTMMFATRGAFKAVRAAQSAALLGWNTAQRGDRLGALLFDEQNHLELPPRRGQKPFVHLLRQLSTHPAWERQGQQAIQESAADTLNQALMRLRRVTQPGSQVILFSDFSGLDRLGSAHLSQLARHNDLLLLDIHDPLEAELPPPGSYRLSDGHRILNLETADEAMRTLYRHHFTERQAELQQLCRRHGITRLPLSCADEPLAALQRALGGAR